MNFGLGIVGRTVEELGALHEADVDCSRLKHMGWLQAL